MEVEAITDIFVDWKRNHSMSHTTYHPLKPSTQLCILPNQVMSGLDECPLLPHPNSDGSTSHLLAKGSTVATSSRVKLPIFPCLDSPLPMAPLPNFSAYFSLKEDRSSTHSSEYLAAASGTWPGSPCTFESSDVPIPPIRQPKGPQYSGNDGGFDWDTYKRIKGRSKNCSTSSAGEPLVSQTRIPNLGRHIVENNTMKCSPELQSRPLANNSTLQSLPPQNLLSYRSSRCGPSETPSASRNTYQDVFDNSGQITNVYQSENMSPEILGHSSQSPQSYISVNSRPATTIPQGQSQLHHQNSAMIRPKQMVPTKPFIPSTMALAQAGVAVRDPARMPLGSKYQGDAFSQSFLRQVPGLPDHFNTSLWLKGLPPGVQPSQIFDMIQCGSVWSLDLKPTTEQHATVAATLTFMTPFAASLFLGHCRFHGLQLDGHWISASYNKFGIPAVSTKESRVLHIEGPPHLMTPEGWKIQFKKACRFQMDRWSYLPCPVPGRLRMEFRFVRVDGQAQSCRQMIERELGHLDITVWYGLDPCGQIGY
jgi:hypothetical protein